MRMRKWILGMGVLALVVASTFVAAPAGADHGMPEGCIVTLAAHACSGAPEASGAGATGTYTVTAGHTVGVTGLGPYTISWTDPDGAGPCASGSHSKGAGEADNQTPLVTSTGCAGTVVTATSTGGALAVGDRD